MKKKKVYGKYEKEVRPVDFEGMTLKKRKALTEGVRGLKAAMPENAYVYPQAENIVRLFGGPTELCNAYNHVRPEGEKKLNRATVYRWMWPKDFQSGTGGEIPTKRLRTILKAARYWGVMVKIEDLYPDLFGERKDHPDKTEKRSAFRSWKK